MQQLTQHGPSQRRTAGWGLTEAVVAMGVLSVGVLGLLWMQGKTALAWRSQYATEQAAWLTQDMAERMRANRGALDTYRLGWGQAAHAVDCGSRPCNLVEWTLSDLWSWTREVQNRMPGAQTQLWQSPIDPQHIGIGLAWRDKDKTAVETTNAPPGLNCPAQHRCFWMHVRP
jgi:type IV pilus assembly protein PilV